MIQEKAKRPREPRSRVLDHTADLRLEIEAPDLPGLFLEAARASLGCLGRLVPSGADGETEQTSFHGRDTVDLLVDWLGEVLYRAQYLGRIPAPGARLEFEGATLAARVAWVPIDGKASRFDREVKAVTYHGLEVTGNPASGYGATFILDV